MANPDYAVEFFNITTELTITILGFALILWVFWWENRGKHIKFEISRTVKYYHFKNMIEYIENKFIKMSNDIMFNKLINLEIPILKISLSKIITKEKIRYIYNSFKIKTRKLKFKSETVQINYAKLFFLMYILIIIITGLQYVWYNIFYVHRIIFFDKENLTTDPTLKNVMDKSISSFQFFIILFAIFLLVIILHSFNYKRIKLRKSRYDFGYIQ